MKKNEFILEKDIEVCRLKASSFPDGVLYAHQALHQRFPFSLERNYFGISRPEHGSIQYWAATEEKFSEELNQAGYDSFVIPKGKYISSEVDGFMKNPHILEDVFQNLIETPDIDPEGYCIEWYIGIDAVRCMVRLSR